MSIEIDHISLSVEDYEKAKAFYSAALKALRGGVLMEFPMNEGAKVMGLGSDGHAFLWISSSGKANHQHIAFRAENRDQVDAFYAAAIAAGGTDNGGPGLRPDYSEHYYAAYVLDPEGHNIEAVTHAPPAAAKRAAPSRRKAAAKKPARKPARAAKPARRTAAKKPATRKSAARKPAVKKPARRGAKRR
jgi:catechol 2,3-dioxygenase-like lactoylglutathione lyase family enzyme